MRLVWKEDNAPFVVFARAARRHLPSNALLLKALDTTPKPGPYPGPDSQGVPKKIAWSASAKSKPIDAGRWIKGNSGTKTQYRAMGRSMSTKLRTVIMRPLYYSC